MNLTAATFLTLGLAALVAGAYLLHPAAALLVGGSGLVGLGILSLDLDRRKGVER